MHNFYFNFYFFFNIKIKIKIHINYIFLLKMDIYTGSKICMLSTQLFLIASLHNFNWGNYIESVTIYFLYITSWYYHSNPTPINKAIDEFMVKTTIIVTVVISLYNYNILPFVCTIILSYMYYKRPDYKIPCTICNLYHASCVHFIAFLGFISIYYNKNI